MPFGFLKRFAQGDDSGATYTGTAGVKVEGAEEGVGNDGLSDG